MKKTVVINIVGLSEKLIGENTPHLSKWIKEKGQKSYIQPILPAVTCSMQATYLTGKNPTEHGIVGNGWYFKDECEIKFWKQSNKLIQSEIIWDKCKKINPDFISSNMFWWYNMYSQADYSVTPRPLYLADGRKIPDCYANPLLLRDQLTKELGTFPLFDFWGPRTSIKSSQWIADASILVDKWHNPTLTFIYLPHLDYNCQRYGDNHPLVKFDLIEIDRVLNQLITYYESQLANIIILSEYGITNVSKPIHINRILRKNDLLAIKYELGLETLDAGASKAFAVVDHQLCHIYINDKNKEQEIIDLLKSTEGIEKVITSNERAKFLLNHERAGDIIVVADKDSWFTYYFWLDDSKAPDYARTVDIHRKPGYDPLEMIANPKIKFLPLKVIFKLLKKKLGFRYLMDIIPLDANLIKGSHGRIPENKKDWPILITSKQNFDIQENIKATDVNEIILNHLEILN
ncbi:MAG: alkaline phosphatase family protein [Cytophagales bacterium]|nr:MAG: alkaline phosphatase family protein [Cytophagales bacterium]